MFTTFKGKIESLPDGETIKKCDAFLFKPSNPYTEEFIRIDISNELFVFSKEDIVFTPKQKIKYGNYLQLHPFQDVGKTFSDGVKYKLDRQHIKGRTEYTIEVDEIKLSLNLNWWNRGLIEWVHGRKVNWNLWQAIIGIVLIIVTIIGIVVQVLATSNSSKDGTDNSTTEKIEKTNESAYRVTDTTKKSDNTKFLNGYYDTTNGTPGDNLFYAS